MMRVFFRGTELSSEMAGSFLLPEPGAANLTTYHGWRVGEHIICNWQNVWELCENNVRVYRVESTVVDGRLELSCGYEIPLGFIPYMGMKGI